MFIEQPTFTAKTSVTQQRREQRKKKHVAKRKGTLIFERAKRGKKINTLQPLVRQSLKEEFLGKQGGNYFLALCPMSHLGNAFCSWSICALEAGLFHSRSVFNRLSFSRLGQFSQSIS